MLKGCDEDKVRPHCSNQFEWEIVVVIVCVKTCVRYTRETRDEGSVNMTAQLRAAAAAAASNEGEAILLQ